MLQRLRDSASGLSPVLQLALISFAGLYLEMIIIRWLASDIRTFAYFKNVPLLAAFLGLGLGCIRSRQRPFGLVPALCLVFAAVVAFAEPLGIVHVRIPQQNDFKFFNAASNFELVHSPVFLLVKFVVVVLGMSLLVVELFATLGGRLGALFDAQPATRAYAVNLAASLAGIWLFALVSWWGWPPAAWFAAGFLALLPFIGRRPLALGLVAATLVVIAVAPGATRWSPYHRIDLTPYQAASTAGQLDHAGYDLRVNHDVLESGFNLSDEFVASHPDPWLQSWKLVYDTPYRFARPQRVLVVGAGMGNDVAAALRHGAEQVDAVEIDPAILELGRDLHPEQPYSSPRVRLIADDARSWFARGGEQYDMVVFGLLDSHTLLSSMSSLRLDNYVYTRESIQQAKALLAPGGHLALTISTVPFEEGGQVWIASRLFQLVTAAFGEEPVTIDLTRSYGLLFMAGPGVREPLATDPLLAALAMDPAQLRPPVTPTTDDWPFVYLRDRSVPFYPYVGLLLLLLLAGGGLVLLTLRGTPPPPGAQVRGLDVPLFLLGAGFMLLEVKGISQLSLLFGSTWIVNALAISAILLLALLANLYVMWRRPQRLGLAYALLILAGLLDYLVPLSALGNQHTAIKVLVGGVLPVLPLAFAGVIFSSLLARSPSPRLSFGSNLLGALVGGLLEYLSMATGFKALGLLALLLYAASWLAQRAGASPAPAAPRPLYQEAQS
jgi:SAM-dependent methyltransferase